MNFRALYFAIPVIAACRRGDEGNSQPTLASEVPASAPASISAAPVPTPSPAEFEPRPVASTSVAVPPIGAAPPVSDVPARSSGPARPAGTSSPSPSPSAPSAAPSVAKVPPAPPRRGAPASGASYETWLETTGSYSAGAASSVIAVVNAKPPYKCNAQYPYKFVLDAPATGLTYPSSTVRGMRVDGKHASMPVSFSAASAGTHVVAGTLSFSTCSEEKCLVDKVHLSVAVDVR